MAFISIDDFLYVAEKIRREPQFILKIWQRVFARNKLQRVKDTYTEVEKLPADKCWWDIPAIKHRWNYLVSGNPAVDHCEYISSKYLSQKSNLTALSLGSGLGTRELRWAEMNKFVRIDGYDVSDTSVRYANELAKQKGYSEVLKFHVADVYSVPLASNSYDVVIGEMSLHHFSPLGTILVRIREALRPGGYLFVDEFVGPTRFQWTKRQLAAINALLTLFPKRYKTPQNCSLCKPKVRRQGTLSMRLSDPSEAVESSKILPLLHQVFEVVETREYGGNLLPMIFTDIASHFLIPDDRANRLLNLCFDAEDVLLATGELQSDYIVAVCQKRST